MSTVFNRMYAFCKEKGVPLQPLEKRKELGKIVAQEYYSKNQKRLKISSRIEDGESVKVYYYPKEFTPELDAIVSNFYLKNPVIIRQKRKRIPLKRELFSHSKPYQNGN